MSDDLERRVRELEERVAKLEAAAPDEQVRAVLLTPIDVSGLDRISTDPLTTPTDISKLDRIE
jgi:hypothetical protein